MERLRKIWQGFWRVVSDADTMFGLPGWVTTAGKVVVSSVVALWAWFSAQPIWLKPIIAVVGFVGIWTILRWLIRRLPKPWRTASVPPPQTVVSLRSEDARLIENIGLSAIDRAHEEMFVIFDSELDVGLLSKENPQLVVGFSAFNGHFHRIRLKTVSGNFKFSGEEIPGEIDFRTNLQTIEYGDFVDFTIRQWIPQNAAAKLRSEQEHRVVVLKFINLVAEAVNSRSLKVVREFRVPLAEQLQFARASGWRASPSYRQQTR